MSRPSTNFRDITIPYSGVLANITHADVLAHYLPLESIDINIVKLLLTSERIGGTGFIYFYPNDGTQELYDSAPGTHNHYVTPVTIKNNHLKYSLTVINDNHQLYCHGYTKQLSIMQRDIR